MLAKVTSCAVVGLDGALIQVEVDIANGLPATTIVGLPDAAVSESMVAPVCVLWNHR
jgi:magnesium chelatase family protein